MLDWALDQGRLPRLFLMSNGSALTAVGTKAFCLEHHCRCLEAKKIVPHRRCCSVDRIKLGALETSAYCLAATPLPEIL